MHETTSSTGISDHCYNDDAQLYLSFSPFSSYCEQLISFVHTSSTFALLSEWLAANRLKLNEDKTDALLVSSLEDTRENRVSLLRFIFGSSSISPSTAVRNLGVIFDSHLSMESHISVICKKAFFHLRRIARIKRYLSTASFKQLVCAFFLSHLEFCNVPLVGYPLNRIAKLQGVQNSAASLILGARWCNSAPVALRTFHWLPVY